MKKSMEVASWLIALIVACALAMGATVGTQASQDKQKTPSKAQPKSGEKAEENADQKNPDDADQQRRPNLLGGSKVTLKSSKQTKNTASAGFNGVGPDGKVQEAMLKASPSEESRQKAMRLSLLSSDAGEVQAFAKEGNLNPPPAKKGK